MSVGVRRAKKERLIKIEEENAAARAKEGQAPEDAATIEAAAMAAGQEYDLDSIFYMVDFPSSQAEILAFGKYSHALNGVFEINEAARPKTAEEEEEEVEGEEEEEEDDDSDKSVKP
jgi:hypothetical protein